LTWPRSGEEVKASGPSQPHNEALADLGHMNPLSKVQIIGPGGPIPTPPVKALTDVIGLFLLSRVSHIASYPPLEMPVGHFYHLMHGKTGS
jgi:hypothetical protein